MHYLYRTTTDKLAASLDKIDEAGDEMVYPAYLGGRDWVVICRRGGGDA